MTVRALIAALSATLVTAAIVSTVAVGGWQDEPEAARGQRAAGGGAQDDSRRTRQADSELSVYWAPAGAADCRAPTDGELRTWALFVRALLDRDRALHATGGAQDADFLSRIAHGRLPARAPSSRGETSGEVPAAWRQVFPATPGLTGARGSSRVVIIEACAPDRTKGATPSAVVVSTLSATDPAGRISRRIDPAGLEPETTAGDPETAAALAVVPVPAILRAVARGLEQHPQLSPGDVDVSDVRVTAAAFLDALRLGGEARRAESAARAWRTRAPQSVEAHRVLAAALAVRGDDEAARDAWRAALELEPGASHLLAGLARSQEELGNFVEAEKRLDAAIAALRARARESDTTELLARLERERRDLASLAQREAERRARWEAARQEVKSALSGGAADSLQDEQEERITHLREVVAREPANAKARVELGEALLAARLFTAAERQLEEVLELEPDAAAALEALARLSILRGRPRRAVEILESRPRPSTAGAHILLGDARWALADSRWRADRWTDYGQPPRRSLRAYLDLEKPGTATDAASIFELAGRDYRTALQLATGSPSAQARHLEWLLVDSPDRATASDKLEELNAQVDSLQVATGRAADLLRVLACAHEVAGRAELAGPLADRFYARLRLAVDDTVWVARRLVERDREDRAFEASDSDDGAGAGGTADDRPQGRVRELTREYLRVALDRFGAHASLRALRGEVRLLQGQGELAMDDLRFALAASQPIWDSLHSEWERPRLGPRSGRAPLIAERSGAVLPGVPRRLFDLIDWRLLLARAELAAGRPEMARNELRPIDFFCRREEERLRGTRRRDPAARSERADELTALEDPRDEPVDFESVAERIRWSRLRTLMARCDLAAGRHERAGRRFAWAARCLVVEEGRVPPETTWPAAVVPPARQPLARALIGTSASYLAAGDIPRARRARRALDLARQVAPKARIPSLEELREQLTAARTTTSDR